MADLFAIIVLMEHLEKAFIRDSITAEEQVSFSPSFSLSLFFSFFSPYFSSSVLMHTRQHDKKGVVVGRGEMCGSKTKKKRRVSYIQLL